MPITQAAIATPPAPGADELAHMIGVDCERALRRLDRLDSERHDVVLAHARDFIRHAVALSRLIERGR
jgi:hypothetical protein